MTINLDLQTWEEFASILPKNASDTEKLMAAVCYRFESEKVDETRIGAILGDYFRRARWHRPVNLAATANHCASKGWLSEAGQSNNHKLWRITRRGYETIRSKFQ